MAALLPAAPAPELALQLLVLQQALPAEQF